jgi:hypothetical protein
MDRLIHKVETDIKKASKNLKKGKKDTKILLKADKHFDKQIEKADEKMRVRKK